MPRLYNEEEQSLINGSGKIEEPCKRITLNHYNIKHQTKNNPKCIKNLNMWSETIKLRRKHGWYVHRNWSGCDFAGFDTKSKNRHVGLHQTESFCTAKETIKWKGNPMNDKTCHVFDNGVNIQSI